METAKWHPAFQHASVAFDLPSVLKLKKTVEAKADTTKLITCLNAGRKSEKETHIYFPCKKQSTLSVCCRVLKSKRCPSDTKSNKWQNTAEKKNMIYQLNTNQNAQHYSMQEKDRSLQASFPQMWWKCDQHIPQQKQLNKAQLLLQLAWPNSIRGER